MRKIMLGVFLLLQIIGFGQNALVPDILPSTDAAALGKHGTFSVSYATGQANISVPVTSISSNGINMGFELNYDGSGIMVDQHPGWVGQNWSLSGGGVITRSVHGIADEEGLFGGFGYYNDNVSYFYTADNFQDWFNEENTNDSFKLKQFAIGKIFTYTAPVDTEPDIFSFNFNGMSGKFYLDQEANWKIISDHNLKIEFDVTDLNNYQDPFIVTVPYMNGNIRYDKVIKGFKIIDDLGNKYTFGYDTSAVEYAIPFFRQHSNLNYFGNPNWIANAWYLTKIEDYIGNTVFDLEYERSYFTANIFETWNAYERSCLIDKFWPEPDEWIVSSSGNSSDGNGSLISPVYLKSVTSNREQKIEFYKSDCHDKELQWTSIFQATTNRIVDLFFTNFGAFIPPYPYLQESGYYSYDPTGALANPIKGLKWQKLDSVKVYSNNVLIDRIALNYNNTVSHRLKLNKVQKLPLLTSEAPIEYSLNYDNFESLPAYFSRRTDHFGYYSGTLAYFPSLPINFSTIQSNYYPSRNSTESNIKLGQLVSIIYPTGGKSEFEYEIHDYTSRLSDNRQNLLTETGSIGGLRIKSIKSFDQGSVVPALVKTYHYKKDYQTGGTQSSGIFALKPTYVWIDWLMPTTFFPEGGFKQSIWSNNALIPLGNKFENHIGYSEVTEVLNDNSFTIYKYTTHNDIKDELPYGNLNLDFSPYARFSDKSHMRGKLVKTSSYDNQSNLVREIINKYYNSTNEENFDEYGISCDAKFNYTCSQSNFDEYYVGNAIKIFHNKFLIDTVDTRYHYGSDIFSTIERLQFDRPIVATNKYAFLAQKSVTNSDNKIFSDHFKYSFNHTSSYAGQNAHMTSLVNAHRFPLVYTEKRVNNIVVDGTQDLYNNFSGSLLPKYKLRNEVTWVGGIPTNAWDTLQQYNVYNLAFIRPTTVTDKGWQPASVILNTRGYPTLWTYGTYSKSYIYYPNDKLQTFTDIDGQQKTFEYDAFNRRKKSTDLPRNVITDYNYHFSTLPSDKSYYKTRTKYPLITNSEIDSIVSYTYADGLGRPIQIIDKYGAPDGTSDVISKTEYDNIGRTYRTYEPISVGGNHGIFYTGAFTGGYTQQLYEVNPLDRPKQTTPPAWQTTNHSYGTNLSSLTNPEGQIYPARSLMITTTTDPDGKSIDTYTDKMGRKILQRRRQSTNTNDIWTVYDDKSRPVKDYPSGSSVSTPGLIYEYRYDGDNNMIYKKVPDAAAELYRYDSRNLEVARRNLILLAQNRWLVTHYDQYGRPSKRGYFNGSNPTPAPIPTIHTLLEEYFYDGFNGSTTNTAPIYKGKLRKKRIKALDDISTNNIWTESEYTYDIYGRVSQENTLNHLGDAEINTYTYDFGDNPLSNHHFLFGVNGVNHLNSHTYDHRGRKIFDRHNLNGTGEVTTSQCNYDHKSQVIERNLGRHATTGTHQYLQSLDYTYNPQGWLTSINTLYTDLLPFISDPCSGGIESYDEPPPLTTDEQDLFALSLDFNSTLSGSGIPASQNGNITALKWWHRNSGQYNQSYTYRYDFLNRVTEAKHGEIKQGVHTLKNQYNEKLQYDPRGNITKLDRRGMVQRPDIDGNCYKPMTIDSLTYVYESGTNKLVQVIDNAPCMDTITLPAMIDRDVNYAAGKLIRIKSTDVLCNVNMNLTAGTEIRIIDTLHIPNSCGTPALVIAYQGPCPLNKYTDGFNQQSISGQYLYDAGGNLYYDPNKKHTFQNNHLNLPYKIEGAENDEIQMLYSADGTLLQRKYVKNNIEISKIDYLRGKELKNGVLKNIYFFDGRIIKTDATFSFEYEIKDHLGNVRVTFADDNNNGLIAGTEIRSRNDYYAFGMEWDNYLQQSEFNNPENRYKYNGKELVEEMGANLLDYHARQMDPILGRWLSIDPISEKFSSWSPYNYVENNPIRLMDPTGLSPEDGGGDPPWYSFVNRKAKEFYEDFKSAISWGNEPLTRTDINAGLTETANDLEPAVDALRNVPFSAVMDNRLSTGEAITEIGIDGAGFLLGGVLEDGGRFLIKRVARSGNQGGLNLFKWGAEQTTKSTGWKAGDYMLHLPNKGTPKLNWKANYSALRREMRLGRPIFDSYRLPLGNLIQTGGFLNAERYVLQSRGWIYKPSRGSWIPPIK